MTIQNWFVNGVIAHLDLIIGNENEHAYHCGILFINNRIFHDSVNI